MKLAVSLPISHALMRDVGEFEGDAEEYARRVRPYRNGILSAKRVSRASRERLVKDSRALRAALREAAEEINDLKAHIDGRPRQFQSFLSRAEQ